MAVAIIGAGSDVATDHFVAFNGLEGVRVVAGVDPAADARDRVAREWDVPVYPDLGTLHMKHQVDLAVVCVPDQFHGAVVEETCSRGWHTLIEKPAADSSDATLALFGRAAECRVQLAVGLQRRHMSARLAQECAGGAVGKIRAVHMHWWTPDDLRAWRRELGGRGGVLADRGVHLLSELPGLFPSAEAVRVTARATYTRGVVPETGVHLTIDYDTGSFATVDVGVARAVPRDTLGLHIVGSLGEVRAVPLTTESVEEAENGRPELLTLTGTGLASRRLARLLTVPECHRVLAKQVVAAVRSGQLATEAQVAAEVDLMGLVDAAYRSIEEGGPVEV